MHSVWWWRLCTYRHRSRSTVDRIDSFLAIQSGCQTRPRDINISLRKSADRLRPQAFANGDPSATVIALGQGRCCVRLVGLSGHGTLFESVGQWNAQNVRGFLLERRQQVRDANGADADQVPPSVSAFPKSCRTSRRSRPQYPLCLMSWCPRCRRFEHETGVNPKIETAS